MSTFTIAAAQSFSVAGDLAANIARHLRFMAVAAEQGVDLLVFPELSQVFLPFIKNLVHSQCRKF